MENIEQNGIAEKTKKRLAERYVALLLKYRVFFLLLIAAVTGIFGYYAWNLKVATDFISFYPPRHPFIQLYNQYRGMFGSANVMVLAVEVKNGDIYNWNTIDKIDRITQAMLEVEGCNPAQLASITHPKLKNVEVTGYGIALKPMIHAGIDRSDLGLQEIKRSIYSNEGVRGFYVSPDDKAAAIYAGFWEEGWDPSQVYKKIEEIKNRETDENHKIYITGYPALYSYIYSLAPQIEYMLLITLAVLLALLFYYFRTIQGIFVPFFSAIVSAVWGLGFASMLGYSLDPLILVVPLIISARLMSHAVQCMSRYYEEYLRLGDRQAALVKGYGEMLAPATLSTITDAVGLLLISVATIPIMRQLGFFSSFWVMSIIVTVCMLNPLMLSFIKPPKTEKIERQTRGRVYSKVSRFLVKPSEGKNRWVVIGVVAFILIVGGIYTHMNLRIGDTEAGSAILFPEHSYNESFRFFNQNFVGATQLIILAEGTVEGAIKDYGTLKSMEEFQNYMETEGGAGGTLTFNNMIKRVYRMFHEGNPKWEMIPKSDRDLAQIGYIIRNNAAPGEMDVYVDYSWTNATITCFYKSYNAELIKNCIAKAREFIEKATPEKVRYRLAGGLLGILYAVNEEVEYSYWVSLIVVFLACFLLCSFTFRSFKCGLILIIPLAVSQIITDFFMLIYGIDININSLPVAAIAVGIGINYGIYLLARTNEEYALTGDYEAANRTAMDTTGKTIVFTESTMLAGIFFMIFVNMKFQSEMGLLLTILMLLNMINALILIPVLVTIFKPKAKAGGLLSH